MKRFKVIEENVVFEIDGNIHIIDVNSICELHQLESEELCIEAFQKMTEAEIIESCRAVKNDAISHEGIFAWEAFFERIKKLFYTH